MSNAEPTSDEHFDGKYDSLDRKTIVLLGSGCIDFQCAA